MTIDIFLASNLYFKNKNKNFKCPSLVQVYQLRSENNYKYYLIF